MIFTETIITDETNDLVVVVQKDLGSYIMQKLKMLRTHSFITSCRQLFRLARNYQSIKELNNQNFELKF